MMSYSDLEPWPPDPSALDLNNPIWVTVEQAAHLTRSDVKTVRRWVRERPIAVFTPGGKTWIDRRRLFLLEPPQTS